MSEQERNKAGLHKEISSIFKGVPIPQTDGSQESSGTPAPERTDHTEPKPPATEPQRPETPKPYQSMQLLPKAAPERTDYTEPKPPAIEPQKPEAPKAYQATQPLPKAAPERTDHTEPKPPAIEPQKPEAPKTYQATQPLPKAAPERSDHTEPKPPAIEPQKPEAPKFYQATQSLPKAATERTDHTEPKLPATEPQKPKAPKAYQATQSLPKAAGAQRPKADIDDIDIEKNISQKGTTVTISSQTFWQRIENKLFTPKPGVSATRQKAMVVMVPLLFIVFIFMFRQVFGTTVRKTEASAEDNISSVATADSNTKIDWEIPAPYPTTLRDPMQLGQVATAQTETETETETRTFVKLIVKGILYAEDKASAVIGNQIVHEGEKIQGMTVIKIGKDSVEFEMNGKRWTQKVQR